MKLHTALAILLAAPIAASIASAGDSAEKVAEKVLAQYMQAYNAGDSAALGQVYDTDAVILPPNGEIVRGRANIEAFWKKGMGKGLKLEVADAKRDGAIGYASGIYSFPPGPKGPSPMDRGKFMVGLKKVSGSWKIAADIWNEPRPPEH